MGLTVIQNLGKARALEALVAVAPLVQKKQKNITVFGQNLAVLIIVLRRLPLRYVFN